MPSGVKSKLILTSACALLAIGAAASAFGQIRLDERLQVRPESMIGITTRDAPADKPEGAVITSVDAGTPAAKAGLKEGDVIVEVDGERVRSSSQLGRLVRETPPDRPVKVVATREGKRVEMTVTPTASNVGSYMFELPNPEFREGPLTRSFRPWLYQGPATPDLNWFGFPNPRTRPGMPRLGISVQPLTPQLAEYFGTKDGVLVATVDDGSAAAKAGLRAGDIITAIDGRQVASARDVQSALSGKRSGDQAKVDIVRDRKPRTMTVTLENEGRGEL